MPDIFQSFSPELLIFLATILFVGGLVRGFAGFGAGMIFMPVAASVISPAIAAASFLVLDFFVTLPMVFRAFRICDWGTVIPAVLGSVIFVHAGAWLLANSDVLLLRWIIFGIVVCLLLLLVSGWRYRGKPTASASFAVGTTSGLLGGISQVSAPPVAALWMSSVNEPAVIRANLIMFFALASIGSTIAYWMNGFFTIEVAHFLIAGVPAYGLAIFLGSRGFGKASPTLYRGIAYTLIAVAAITSLPLLDPVLR